MPSARGIGWGGRAYSGCTGGGMGTLRPFAQATTCATALNGPES